MSTKMKLIAVIALLCCTLLAGCGWVTVVPIEAYEASMQNGDEINPVEYASEIWPAVLDYARKNAHPVESVVPLFLEDEDKAGNKYGYRLDEKSWWQFIVEGNARVLKYNTESKAGVLELDLEPYDGVADCNLQIGPIVKGQAVRDSMPFIKFQDFKDQVQYGKIAAEINNYAIENVVTDIVTPEIEGKSISFIGAFTAEPGKGIIIVPVELAIIEE